MSRVDAGDARGTFSAGGAVLETLEGDHLVQRVPGRVMRCTRYSLSER